MGSEDIERKLNALGRRIDAIQTTEDPITVRLYVETLHDAVKSEIINVEKQIISLEKEVDRRFGANREETAIALESLRQHLAVMNEFRATIDDILTRLVKTDTCQLIHQKVDEAIADIREQLKTLQLNAATLAGKASVEDVQDARDRATSADSKALAAAKAADEAHKEAVSARRVAWAGVTLVFLASIIVAIIQAI